MANASAITVTALTANTAGVVPPTADVLDTGTAAVTLDADVGGSGMVLFEFTSNHASSVNTTFTILAGDNPPAQRAGLGNLATVCAQNVTKLVGPLETARFIQSDGKISVTTAPASGTIAATIRCYKFPKTA